MYRFEGFNFTMEYYMSHFLVLQRSKPKDMDIPKEVRVLFIENGSSPCIPGIRFCRGARLCIDVQDICTRSLKLEGKLAV